MAGINPPVGLGVNFVSGGDDNLSRIYCGRQVHRVQDALYHCITFKFRAIDVPHALVMIRQRLGSYQCSPFFVRQSKQTSRSVTPCRHKLSPLSYSEANETSKLKGSNHVIWANRPRLPKLRQVEKHDAVNHERSRDVESYLLNLAPSLRPHPPPHQLQVVTCWAKAPHRCYAQR